MQQYFIKGRFRETTVQIEDKETAKHMFSVMRLEDGDQVILVFDDAIKRLSKVIDKENYILEVLEELPDQVELPVQVTIAVGFPKGDKLDLIAQKATELGVSSVWAYPADWSVVKWDVKKLIKKVEKLERIVRGASEQSKRNRVPDVHLFSKIADFQAELGNFDKIFVAYEEAAKNGEKQILDRELATLKAGQSILFIFGPEGGISPEEMKQFKRFGGKAVGLGPRIMRAETAPLYALSVVSFTLELRE